MEDQWEIMLERFRYFDTEFTISIKLTLNKLVMWQPPWGTYLKTNKEKVVIEAVEFDTQSCLRKYELWTIVKSVINIRSFHAKDTREILRLDSFSMIEWDEKALFIIVKHWQEYLKPFIIQLKVNTESIKPPVITKRL